MLRDGMRELGILLLQERLLFARGYVEVNTWIEGMLWSGSWDSYLVTFIECVRRVEARCTLLVIVAQWCCLTASSLYFYKDYDGLLYMQEPRTTTEAVESKPEP